MIRSRTCRLALLALPLVLVGKPIEAQRPARGESYALLVGVREYDPAELRGLKFPEADIDGLAETLRGAGYRPENLKVMTQTLGATRTRFLPTGANIRRELGLMLKPLEPADRVLVALAGHGVQFRDGDEAYYCPADARLNDRSSLIPLSEFHRALEGCGAGFKLLLVDACRNDPLTAVSRDAAGRAVVDLPSLSRPILRKPPGGVAAFFSCSPGEIAFENPELKHGVFFHFIIKGLEGDADADADGKVDLDELSAFTKKRVFRFVDTTYGREQTPELDNRTRGSVAIVDRSRVEVRDIPPPRPPAEKVITNSIGMKLTLIPAGEFLMGSPDSDTDAGTTEKPQHRVRITRPFYLGVHEVTQGQYRAVTGQDPSSFKGSDDLPVEKVSWHDAIAFCNTLSEREGLKPYYQFGTGAKSGGDGYRLPTEAEWEYACRAGTTKRYSFGDDAARLGEYDWFDGNSQQKTHAVGQKRPNAFGLYDMHGNVWEWCWDGYQANYYKEAPEADPSGPLQASARVIRGGSWIRNPRDCRSAFRDRFTPGNRFSDLGFRLARVQSAIK
jgi:formylglycine-generating enzyme required for sulfatase activity